MGDTTLKEVESTSKIQQLLHHFRNARSELKQTGVKGLFRRYGWKLFAAVFIYYLIRDITLYVLIPWLLARHLMSV